MAIKIKFNKASLNEYLNRYYAYFAIVLVLLILALGGVFLVYPQYQKLRIVQEEQLSSSEYDLLQKTQYLQGLREMEENFSEQNISYYRNIDKVIFSESDFPLLFTRLENITDSVGMQIVNLNYAPLAEEDTTKAKNKIEDALEEETVKKATKLPNGINKLSVNMTVQSPEKNWPAFKNLINTLDMNIQLLEIENIAYSPGTETYSLSFFVYYKE